MCGGIVKKRVALPGRGKRGGATISAAELEALQILAEELLSRTDKDLDALMQTDKLSEMCFGYQN